MDLDFEHINLRMPKTLMSEIDKLVEENCSTQSQIIREAVKKGLPLIK